MNAATFPFLLPFSPSLSCNHRDVRPNPNPKPGIYLRLPLRPSAFLFRRRRAAKPPPPERRIELSIDPYNISRRASRLLRSSEQRLRRVLSDGAEAYRDLRTSVRTERGGRVVFSCRQSSVLFVRNLLLWGFAVFVVFWAITWLRRWLIFRNWWVFGDWAVVRRDRSLAGREVVVGRTGRRREEDKSGFRASASPLSLPRGMERSTGKNVVGKKRVEKQERLPEWWPESVSSALGVSVGKEELQREANRLVRDHYLLTCLPVIMDNRMIGKDYMDDDIIQADDNQYLPEQVKIKRYMKINTVLDDFYNLRLIGEQLRHLCKISGAKVSFETANARDSFYRAAVDFVLNTCSRVMQPTSAVQIDGEEARQFISGLADNIGLENVRAAKLVRAAVAARTRSLFLQSWALEVQGRRPGALEELTKICIIHRLFPPEEDSPEIEMVASGLERNLRIEQRKHLLNLFGQVCGIEGQKVAAEALGLLNFNGSEDNGDGYNSG